jgi:hypothetical protein
VPGGEEERFLGIVSTDDTVRAILERGPERGGPRVYAPHGYDDLFAMVVRRNRRLAPRQVYEAKAARWLQQWPELTVLPWDDDARR